MRQVGEPYGLPHWGAGSVPSFRPTMEHLACWADKPQKRWLNALRSRKIWIDCVKTSTYKFFLGFGDISLNSLTTGIWMLWIYTTWRGQIPRPHLLGQFHSKNHLEKPQVFSTEFDDKYLAEERIFSWPDQVDLTYMCSTICVALLFIYTSSHKMNLL